MAFPGFLMLCFLGFAHRSRMSSGEKRKRVCFSLKDTWTRKGEGEPIISGSLQMLPGIGAGEQAYSAC